MILTMPASATVPDSRAQDWSHAFQALVDGIQLPSREVKNFAGDPLDYHRFIIDFDDNISSCVKDPMTKLGKLMRRYSRPSLLVHQERPSRLPGKSLRSSLVNNTK